MREFPRSEGLSGTTYLQPVRSRRFKAIGYDWKSHSLEVEFLKGQLYRYFDVPDSVYYALMASVSKDSYFDAMVHRRYAFRRVR